MRTDPVRPFTAKSAEEFSPTVAGLALAALALAVLLSGLLAVFPDGDPDVWWHIKTGQVILHQGSVPRTDIFSYTAAGRPWVTHEWLAEVIIAVLYGLGGINLLLIFKAFLVAAAVALGAAAALVGPDRRVRMPAVALGALLAGPLLATRAFVRPHLFTAVLIGLTLLLLRLESASGRRRHRVGLAVMFLVWANLHSGFVLGLALVGLYWLAETLTPARGRSGPPAPAPWRMRLRWMGVFILVTLLNPNHVQALLYPFRLVARSEVTRSIGELHPVFHADYRGALFQYDLLAVAVLLVVLLFRSRGRVDRAVLLPGLVFGVMALRAIRGVNEFAVLVPALLGVHGAWLGRSRRRLLFVSAAVAVLAIAGAVTASLWGIPMGREGPRKAGLGIAASRVPVAAADFLRETRPHGRMFNTLGYGGYLIYRLWPEQQVYVDGRLDVYPSGFLDAYGRLMSRAEGWDEACRKFDITTAVLDYRPADARDPGLRNRLRKDPEWVCVFFSQNSVIYARRVPENDSLLARFACPFDPTVSTVGWIWKFVGTSPPEEVEQSIGAMKAMSEVAPRDKFILVVLGQMLDAAGRSAEGADRIRQALRLAPESPDARMLLAGTLGRAGAYEEARQELAPLLGPGPSQVQALLVLGEVEQRQGNLDAARAAAEKAAGRDPRSYPAQIMLARICAGQGRYDEAKACYRRALALRPGDPVADSELRALSP